jgi:gliding motility-associated-like protein
MANAFTPDGNGQNDEIKPILTFRPDEYYFAVYDRWGSIVFETTDIDEYWNGDINNKKDAPPGVYIYYLKITTSGNIIKEKKGTITLFYP